MSYKHRHYEGLAKALRAMIEGTISSRLAPSEFVAAMNLAAMARIGQTNFDLTGLDPVYLERLRTESKEFAAKLDAQRSQRANDRPHQEND